MRESRRAAWRRLWAVEGMPLGARLSWAWSILVHGGLEREPLDLHPPEWLRRFLKDQ